jgi:hypothetical protein
LKLSQPLLQSAVHPPAGAPAVAVTAAGDVHSVGVCLSGAAMADAAQRSLELDRFRTTWLAHAGSIGDAGDAAGAFVGLLGAQGFGHMPAATGAADGIALFGHVTAAFSDSQKHDNAAIAIHSIQAGADAIDLINQTGLLRHVPVLGQVAQILQLGGGVATMVHDFRQEQATLKPTTALPKP